MRLAALILATFVCAVGVVFCDNKYGYGYGYGGYDLVPYYGGLGNGLKPPGSGSNLYMYFFVFIILIALFPTFFSFFTSGLQNFANGITGGGGSTNNSYNGAGNVPSIG